MRNKYLNILLSALALTLILCGCGETAAPTATTPAQTTTEPTAPAPTVPADGNPNDVTCKGSYTGSADLQTVVAAVGEKTLTNGQLQAHYWAEVAAYQQSGAVPAPDFSQPLDTQPCGADPSLGSWQQYFLRRALNTWHSTQALILQGQENGLPLEEAYKPDLEKHAEYLVDIPVVGLLYGYEKSFQPNSMHQAYLDAIPETLETLAAEKGYASAEAMAQQAFGISKEALITFTDSYNRAYMYYTNLTYYIEPTAEEIEEFCTQWALDNPEKAQEDGTYVSFRHILLVPEGGAETAGEESWQQCLKEAEDLKYYWRFDTKHTEATFADLAHLHSEDSGSALNGGLYRQVQQGQLLPELDAWCFDPARQPGDMEILRTQAGMHILYFSKSQTIPQALAEEEMMSGLQADLLTLARQAYPMKVTYSAITLAQASGGVSLSDLLYPDIAHERYPEIPLYLQQDYPDTKYGNYPIRTNGCGITTLAMLASYMADDELTPPEMCARYGGYSHKNGTDGMIFIHEPPVLGFYLRQRTFNPADAKQALQDGYIVISVQTKGYWTRGGHYIAIEKIFEDGSVQVRDSNLFNYGTLEAHKEDRHTWESIIRNGHGFWVFENKITAIPACHRCGDAASVTGNPMLADYTCEKCSPALLRRAAFLTLCAQN